MVSRSADLQSSVTPYCTGDINTSPRDLILLERKLLHYMLLYITIGIHGKQLFIIKVNFKEELVNILLVIVPTLL
jgi:hypothetical protein